MTRSWLAVLMTVASMAMVMGCPSGPDMQSTTDSGQADSGVVADAGAALVCTMGNDSTCNDVALDAGVVGGVCTATGCRCSTGFELNPTTGRCKPDIVVNTVCTVGDNSTCDDEGGRDSDAGVVGTCTASGCICTFGYSNNPNTGRCRARRAATCTLGNDLTCNANQSMATAAGRCLSGIARNTCNCNSGFTPDPVTGLCG